MIEELENGYDKPLENKGYVEPNISQEEEIEVKRLMDLFYIYKRYRSRYDKRWLDYYRIVRGKQWDSRRPTWKNSEVINFIWQTIQSQIPLQTDVRPRFSFLPTEPSDIEFSKLLDQIAEADFERYNWLRVVYEVLFDGWMYGTSIASVKYDQSLEYGLGASVFKSEDLFKCYPHPDANTINDPDGKTFIYAGPESTEKLKHEFPEKAKYIRKDIVDKLRKERTLVNGSDQIDYFNSDLELPMGNVYGSSDAVLDDIPRTMVFRFYMLPKEVEETEESEIDEQTGEEKKSYTVKRKYPDGRYVVIANKMILYDGPLEYDDLKIPYAKYNNYILPREFYGISEVEQLESPQAIFNKMLCFSLDALAMTGNPIWIIDSNAEVDTENLNNVPGAVVEKNPGTEVRREVGAGPSPAAFTMLNNLQDWFNTVAGNSEFSEGQAPGGVTAASAIEQLIRASRTRIRQKQRNLDEFMKNAGELWMNRVFQFYDVPKIYRLTNSDGSQEFRKFRVEKDEQGQTMAVFNDYEENDTNELIELPERRLLLKGRFDVRVTTGSELPFDIADNERKALALFDRGIIDEEEVLVRTDYPNREKILARLQERKQAEMQAAQQQQGGQGA
jgi:hypothetical protein